MKVDDQKNKMATQKGKNHTKIKNVYKDLSSQKHFQQQQPQMLQESKAENSLKYLKAQTSSLIKNGEKDSNEVPIYSFTSSTADFKATIDDDQKAYFACGTLLGKFYEKEGNLKGDVKFVGNFKGSVQYRWDNENPNSSYIYFEGTISKLIIFIGNSSKNDSIDKTILELANEETSFRGFFKGKLYNWSSAKRQMNIPCLQKLGVHEIADKLSKINIQNVISYTKTLYDKDKHFNFDSKKKQELSYFVPSIMRFEVQDVREINLQKSMAVVSGYLHLQFKYNKKILDMMIYTLNKKRKEKKKQNESLLNLVIQFNRDFSLNMPLQEVLSGIPDLEEDQEKKKNNEDEDQDAQSSSSEWSIQDKTWDIQYSIDTQQNTISFQIWKRFNAEIDYSYGSFFAPFSLSVLRIVVTVNSFTVLNQKDKKIKINLSGCDIVDTSSLKVEDYNPFNPINDIDNNFFTHRLHKINRLRCKDNGIYIIADNRLTIYPHYKNTLMNKNTSNDNSSWGVGIYDKNDQLQAPKVQTVSKSYYQFEKNIEEKYTPFAFQKWNYFSIEIPIYKYIAIEMIQIFVPLILLSIISLLIFYQSNGISNSSGFTTLSLRIVNVCSLMIAYVSLIPTLRQNLPPMPTVTFIEIITYIETLPNLLALVNSMVFYNVSMSEWQSTYQTFHDSIFLICFCLSAFSLLVLLIVFAVYASRQYNARVQTLMPLDKSEIKYYSPHYMNFMQQLRNKLRPEYKIKCEDK